MAFDQPLESDNVEDNLLVSLIRGPIIGGLMWILGDDEDEKQRQEAELQQGLQDMILDDIEDEIEHPNAKPTKSLPGLVRCDLSVGMEITGDHQHHHHNLHGSQRASSSDSISSNNSHNPRPVKKKMSWSDNLVEYLDESIRHEPSAAGNGNSPTMSKPIKSAMTRSTSMRSYPLAGGGSCSSAAEDKEQKIRYLPNGLDRAHNGLIMPTRPMGMGVGSDPQGNGQISPQLGWGFYTNLTPPTPEMYHSRRSSSGHNVKSDHSTASGASALSSEGSTFGHSAARGPNRVFQGLKAGSNRPPIGWPSVPL